MAHSLVGLSDSKFDFDLVKKEIDHDFFDNPATSSIDETNSSNLTMEKVKEQEPCEEPAASSSAHKEEENQKVSLDLCQNLPNDYHESGEDTGDNFNSLNIPEYRSPSKRSSPAPSSLVFSSKDASNNSSNDEETPVNCPFNNFGTGFNHQNIFCTGDLLECLPNAENCPSHFRGNDVEHQPGSFAYYQLMSQCASSKEQQRFSKSTQQYHHQRLFDLSDSSSDDLDSQSESSEIASLDTDDEEFVNLLEKYYDSIDLGDSDYSDITEVSPLSSLAPSPLPPLNGGSGRAADEVEAGALLDSNEILLEGNPEVAQSAQPVSIRNSMFQKRCPPEAKPLPPLIIHTMEEIAAPTPEEPNTPLAIAINSLDSAAINRIKSSSSLLMTVGQGDNNQQGQTAANCFDPIKATTSEDSSSRGSSEERMRQSLSFTSSSRMSSGILSSSSSSQNEWSVGTGTKSKQFKNYTFTPDQVRRIDRENSILLRKILDTNKSHGHGHGNLHHHHHHWLHVKGTIHHHRSSHHHHHHHQSHKSSSAILRQRHQKRIDHENSILVRRLRSVKPSKEIADAGFRPSTNGTDTKNDMKLNM